MLFHINSGRRVVVAAQQLREPSPARRHERPLRVQAPGDRARRGVPQSRRVVAAGRQGLFQLRARVVRLHEEVDARPRRDQQIVVVICPGADDRVDGRLQRAGVRLRYQPS